MAVIGDLVVRYGATTTGFDKGTRRVRGGLTSITKGVTRMIGTMAPLAGGALFASMARNAEMFTRKMNQSLAIMGDVSEATQKQMSKAAFLVARDTVFSAEQAAESYFFLASAGLSAEQSLAAIPVVAKFAQAGMFDMARATDLLTDAQSALGLTVDDTTQNMKNMLLVSDVLVKANTLANASVEQFSQSLTTKAAAALRIVNKDIEEGVAVLAAFADQGLKGSDAGTALNIVMRDLQTKALLNKKAFEEAGIAVFDSAGEMNNLADIVGDLEDRLSGMSDATKKQTLLNLGFADKSVIFIQTLIGMSDKIREYERELRIAGGTTEDVASKQMTPMQKAMAKLGAEATQLGVIFNSQVMPSVTAFLGVLTQTLRILGPLVPFITLITAAVIAYALAVKTAAAAQAFLTALAGPKGWVVIAGAVGVAAIAVGVMSGELDSIAGEAKAATAEVEKLAEAGKKTKSRPGGLLFSLEDESGANFAQAGGQIGFFATKVEQAQGQVDVFADKLERIDRVLATPAGVFNFAAPNASLEVQARLLARVGMEMDILTDFALAMNEAVSETESLFGSVGDALKFVEKGIAGLKTPLEEFEEMQRKIALAVELGIGDITQAQGLELLAEAAEKFDEAIGGPAAMIRELNDEMRILAGTATASSIALEKLAEAGATPGQIQEIRRKQAFVGQREEEIAAKQAAKAAGLALAQSLRTPQEKLADSIKEINDLFAGGEGSITAETRRRALEALRVDEGGDGEAPRERRFGAALQAGTTAAFSGIVASLARTSGDRQKDIADNTKLTAVETEKLNANIQDQIDNEPVPVNIDGAPE